MFQTGPCKPAVAVGATSIVAGGDGGDGVGEGEAVGTTVDDVEMVERLDRGSHRFGGGGSVSASASTPVSPT